MKHVYRVTLEWDEDPPPQLTPDRYDLRHWLLQALTTTTAAIERPNRIAVEEGARIPWAPREAAAIIEEFLRRATLPEEGGAQLRARAREFAASCWRAPAAPPEGGLRS